MAISFITWTAVIWFNSRDSAVLIVRIMLGRLWATAQTETELTGNAVRLKGYREHCTKPSKARAYTL